LIKEGLGAANKIRIIQAGHDYSVHINNDTGTGAQFGYYHHDPKGAAGFYVVIDGGDLGVLRKKSS
jgi:hypothetical protein